MEVHTWIRYGQALGMLQIIDQQELHAVVQYRAGASARLSLPGLMDLPWMGYLYFFSQVHFVRTPRVARVYKTWHPVHGRSFWERGNWQYG